MITAAATKLNIGPMIVSTRVCSQTADNKQRLKICIFLRYFISVLPVGIISVPLLIKSKSGGLIPLPKGI